MDKKTNANMQRFQEILKKAGKDKDIKAPSSSRPSSGSTRKIAPKKQVHLGKAPEHATVVGEILIVEENHRLAMTLENQLKAMKFDPTTATTGAEAIQAMDILSPLAILVSNTLPDMTGFTCCSRLRATAKGQEVPILLVTDTISSDVRNGAVMVGANDIIAKPIRIPELVQKIRDLSKK